VSVVAGPARHPSPEGDPVEEIEHAFSDYGLNSRKADLRRGNGRIEKILKVRGLR